jgi:2-amino-4-hydroxy-6-hydroxymethyldihydropteridine diphosphokinase
VSEPVLLGLGANVGDALGTLTAAVRALDELDGLEVIDVSGVYETDPWPPADDPRAVPQEPFLNLVVRAETTLEPLALLRATQRLEVAMGRDRSREVRWGPRPLDIDLLIVGDRQFEGPELTVPHPRLAERAFVLVPLLEVVAGGALPDGRRFTQLLAALTPIEGIRFVVRLEGVPSRGIARPQGPSGPPATFERAAGGFPDDDPAAGSAP